MADAICVSNKQKLNIAHNTKDIDETVINTSDY
jgi:hypothetical protein